MAGKRLALLIGSNIKATQTMANIKREIVDLSLKTICESITNISNHSFQTIACRQSGYYVNPKRSEIVKSIEKIESIESDDLVLIYYFGHGFIDESNYFTLCLPGIDKAKSTQAYTLNSLISELLHKGFEKFIIILDSCHAGLSELMFNDLLGMRNYFLMASSWNGYSLFNSEGGNFTQQLSEGLISNNIHLLRDPRTNAATFQTWFNYAQEYSGKNNHPYSSGTIGNEVFRQIDLDIRKSFDESVQIKSLYSKFYRLLELLNNKNLSSKELYNKINDDNIESFKVRYYYNGELKDDFVKVSTITKYLNDLSELGLVIGSPSDWILTQNGIQAISSDGMDYNLELVKAIKAYLPKELNIEQIRSILFTLCEKAKLPNITFIVSEIIKRGLPVINRKMLRTILRLLSYTGILQRASADTFLPK